MHLLFQTVQLNLETRRQRQIRNLLNWEAVRYGDRLRVADFAREYPRATHRPVDPSRKYNCHGLTFAGRRTWIDEPAEVGKILNDDEYRAVSPEEVLPGDVAVYYTAGDAEHSGIVVDKGDIAGPLILSKWGPYHEVVHRVAECPYDSQQVIFYRIRS